MSIVENLKQRSLHELFRMFATKAALRRQVIRVIDRKAYEALVINNRDGVPPGAAEERHLYLMALLRSFDRVMARGGVSPRVVDVMLNTLAFNIVLNKPNQDALAESLGFFPPEFLAISPTKLCNLRCTGCYAASLPSTHESLPFWVADRIIKEMKELWRAHFVTITGGEPFAWRDDGKGLLDLVARHPDHVFMTYTNGTLINEAVARRLGELGNLTPSISVEGFEEETDRRRGKGTYAKVMRAMELLRKHGVVFGVSTVPTRQNWEMLISDRFAEYYFDEQGALYGWLFQYMPHGRDDSYDLMVTPEQRLSLLRGMRRHILERGLFLLDFWNSGAVSRGCISAGRRGGFFHIDWNGGISPCVFVPYVGANIIEIFERGGTLNDAYHTPLLREVRAWQEERGWDPKKGRVGNWLLPCPARDHFRATKRAVLKSGARPMNPVAASAVSDPEHERVMVEYGESVAAVMDPVWDAEYVRADGRRQLRVQSGR